MRRNFLLFLTALLCSVTISVAQTHTNYISAIGENGYSLTASITAPADDTQQLIGDPVPEGWTINGTINIPGGDFVSFTKADIGSIIYTYSGVNFSNPGTYSDINFFEFEASSNLGSLYSAHGEFPFILEFATGAWVDNFIGNQKGNGEHKYSVSESKATVDHLLISDSPAAAPTVPLSPWMIVIPLLLFAILALYRMRGKATV